MNNLLPLYLWSRLSLYPVETLLEAQCTIKFVYSLDERKQTNVLRDTKRFFILSHRARTRIEDDRPLFISSPFPFRHAEDAL